MIQVSIDKCIGCKICEKNCPVDAIHVLKDKKAYTNENCVTCGICVKVCPTDAITNTPDQKAGTVVCTHCPVRCSVPEGTVGSCTRYTNKNGKILRNRKLVIDAITETPESENLPYKPVITAVGSGTNYPCCRPAPLIVQENIEGVDVVTVATEAPLSYSGVKVKLDTNIHIGEEGAKVKRAGKLVGMITTEEYGSKMLTIGGANLLSNGNDGFVVAKTIVELANGKEVEVRIDKGSKLVLKHGAAPIVDGVEENLMRVGCGSATVGMFAKQLSEVVHEVIVLDYHVIGLLSEHLAGEEVGMEYSHVVPYGTKSTRGRYFGEQGHGWGGTKIENPVDAIVSVDIEKFPAGKRILVTETTGQKSALLEVQEDASVKEIEMTSEVLKAVQLITDTCEESRVSVIYTGGTGGSARAGVTTFPKKLTDAVHNEEIRMTVSGAPTFILPGGGINFMVDAGKMVADSITWVATPATVAPVEYTMTRDRYEELGGHIESIITKEELLKRLQED